MKTARCFNFDKCHNHVNINSLEVNWAGLKLITPKTDYAVWTCIQCRAKPKLLKAARELMFKRFGEKLNGRTYITTDKI